MLEVESDKERGGEEVSNERNEEGRGIGRPSTTERIGVGVACGR
jgi:hypothetical protein